MQMDITRIYSTMVLKGVDEDKREITGVASSPSTDRHGDIVEPRGAEFTLPVPFLWQHKKDQPVGQVISARVTESGIEIKARLVKPTPEMPPQMAARLEEAWQSIKTGLVRGLSIGFSPTEYSILDNGGYHFLKWNWHELSAVTIAANQDASITSIKSIDTALRAASGANAKGGDTPRRKPPSPGVSGTQKQPALGGFFYAQNKVRQMNIQDQIKALEEKRKALVDERTEIQTKAVAEGRTKDAEEQDRFADITAEVSAIGKELDDLRVMEKDLVASARPVQGTSDTQGTESRYPSVIHVKDNRVRDKGLALAQMAKCMYLAQGNLFGAAQLADQAKHLDPRVPLVLKAAVAAGSTSNTSWAGNLVGTETSVYADFIEFLRPQTVLGRFGQGGVPSLRAAPFRTALIGQTSGGAGYWVGEGQAKPLTKFDFSRTTLAPLKVANIAVLTDEVVRDSSPSADVIVRDQLVAALRERLDIDFIDPAKAAAAGVSPASVTNGVTPIPSSGATADDVRTDLKALFGAFIAANNAPTSGVFIMSATTALALSLMTNPIGQPEFPGITMSGGTFSGLPVIVTEYVPTDSSGSLVILANASDIYLGDEGGFQIDMTGEASLEMEDAPANPTTATTVLVSLFQRNLVGFRAERTINWAKRRPSAVQYLSGVTWGAGV